MVHSGTKFIAGHSDSLIGAICTNSESLYERLVNLREMMGNISCEFTSKMCYMEIQTIKIRVNKIMKNGLLVARFLKDHDKVEKVLHPLIENHPGYSIMMK